MNFIQIESVARQQAQSPERFDQLRPALGRIALQQNSDMRKISAWVALAALPTLVAGLYGMNFDNIPLEHWE